MCAIYIITIPKRTNRARYIRYRKFKFNILNNLFRSILFCGMFIYVLLERYYQMSSVDFFYLFLELFNFI